MSDGVSSHNIHFLEKVYSLFPLFSDISLAAQEELSTKLLSSQNIENFIFALRTIYHIGREHYTEIQNEMDF